MTRPQLTDHEVFQLAGYAYSALNYLIAEAQVLEPSIEFQITLNFNNSNVEHGQGHVDVYGHWKQDGMFLYDTWCQTKEDIDHLAGQLKAAIANPKLEGVAA